MDDVLEGIGRFFLQLLKWIFIDAILEFFIRGIGYINLKLITFGKYPRQGRDDNYTIVMGFVSIVGILFLIALSN